MILVISTHLRAIVKRFVDDFGDSNTDAGNWPFYDYCHPPAPWAQNSKQKRWNILGEWRRVCNTFFFNFSGDVRVGHYENTFILICVRREFWAAREDWENLMEQPYMLDYIRVYQWEPTHWYNLQSEPFCFDIIHWYAVALFDDLSSLHWTCM